MLSRFICPLQLRGALMIAAAAILAQQSFAADPATSAEAKAIHERLLTIDSHIDFPTTDPSLVLRSGTSSQFDLEQARNGGLDGAALAVFVPQDDDTADKRNAAKAAAEAKYKILLDLARQSGGKAVIVRSPDEFRAAAKAGRFAIIPSFLNAYSLDSVADIDSWAARGVQLFGLVHAGHNAFTDSSRPALPRGDKPELHGGLSALGRDAVARLNALGVVIDVSQLSQKAFRDTLSLTRAPVIASHSSVATVVPSVRNLTDAELDLIKANGGVVQVNAFSAYLRKDAPETTSAIAALQKEYGIDPAGNAPLEAARRAEYTKRYYEIRGKEPKATLAQFVDHIDYAVKRIGIDHVGISSDFNHGGGVVGWANVGESANVTAELLRRGYKEADIAKLWGGNFVRVWEKAKALRRSGG